MTVTAQDFTRRTTCQSPEERRKSPGWKIWQIFSNGAEYYSLITGLCEYQKDKDSTVVYFSTAGFTGFDDGKLYTNMNPYLTEFNWGAKEPSVIIKMKSTLGYQAFPFDLQKAFSGLK